MIFFFLLTKASGTDRLQSLFLTSQILPRYFTQEKLQRQAVTIHSEGAFFYLFVLLSSIYGFPLTVQNRDSNGCAPSRKKDGLGAIPCRRGQLWAVSCQHFQQPRVGGSWPINGELSKASTVSTTLSNHQIHILNSKKEKGASSSSLRTCPRRDAFCFCTHVSFTSSHIATTSGKEIAEYGLYYGWLYAQP